MPSTSVFSNLDAFPVSEKFSAFFAEEALERLMDAIDLAIIEDGPDLTSYAIFSRTDKLTAQLVAKEDTLVVGLPVIPLAFGRCVALDSAMGAVSSVSGALHCAEGDAVKSGTVVAELSGPARLILKAERIMLNFITHLSGIANLTKQYADQLAGTKTRLLDTRKTLPGLRYPEKYAVLMGGGLNHRKNLAEMLMPKDNHIDAAGGIAQAVAALRTEYSPCPPIEVECRNLDEVRQALEAKVERIMLDNMDLESISQAMSVIPPTVETEVSGGVTLESIRSFALVEPRGPDFVSVGRLTHSAPAADFSLRIART